MYTICVHISVQYMYNECTSCVANSHLVNTWPAPKVDNGHNGRQQGRWYPGPHSGCLNEVCPAFRNKYLQCAVSQKGQGYHFCSKLTMISVFLQNTQLVSNCVGFWKHGNMAILQEDKMTCKDKNRNWGEATETQCIRLLIVACAMLLIVQGRHLESIWYIKEE